MVRPTSWGLRMPVIYLTGGRKSIALAAETGSSRAGLKWVSDEIALRRKIC